MCMRVEFHQRKNGLSAFFASSMKRIASFVNSSSMVSIRFLVERAGALDLLRAVRVRPGVDHAARAVLLPHLRVLEVVRVLRLVLGVQVVERAVELVEAVHGRQMLVEVAEVVLAELTGHVALRLEQLGDRDVPRLKSFLGAGQPDLEQAGAEGRLAGDERGASRGAALLAVPVGEQRAFLRDAIDVGRLVAHHALVVGAEVPVADVVAPDDEDVGLLLLGARRRRDHGKSEGDGGAPGCAAGFHGTPFIRKGAGGRRGRPL